MYVGATALALGVSIAGRAASGSWRRRLVVYVRVFLTWLVRYRAVARLGVPHDAGRVKRSALENSWAAVPWSAAGYPLTYPLVLLAPLLALRARDLRRFAVAGLIATAVLIPFYPLLPLVVESKPLPSGAFLARFSPWRRGGDTAVAAFSVIPSFHVVWTLLAARLYAQRWPGVRWPPRALVVVISVGSVLSGTETVANVLGIVIATMLAGADEFPWLVAMELSAIAGAAIWAQVVEGSNQLLRSYEYFGSVIAIGAVVLLAARAGRDGWLLFTAIAASAFASDATERAGRRARASDVPFGGVLTAFAGAPAPAPSALPVTLLPGLAVLWFVPFAAYSVDVPRTNVRFSRLT